MYRNPTDTVYSQMNYYKENTNDKVRIQYWANLYGKHLSKWLVKEDFTKSKTVLKYQNLKQDINSEFKKVCDHFSEHFDEDKLMGVLDEVSKESLKKKTTHDQQVVNLSARYEEARESCQAENQDFIIKQVLQITPLLKDFI